MSEVRHGRVSKPPATQNEAIELIHFLKHRQAVVRNFIARNFQFEQLRKLRKLCHRCVRGPRRVVKVNSSQYTLAHLFWRATLNRLGSGQLTQFGERRADDRSAAES